MLAKRALRRTALGVDRNHDRYWTFPSASPGLYVEKGTRIMRVTRVHNKMLLWLVAGYAWAHIHNDDWPYW